MFTARWAFSLTTLLAFARMRNPLHPKPASPAFGEHDVVPETRAS